MKCGNGAARTARRADECGPLGVLADIRVGIDNPEAATRASRGRVKQSATWTSRESNPLNRITLDRRPEALGYSAGNGVAKGLAHVVDVLDAARAGGNRTRVSTSSPHTFRPSSGIGIRAATPRSVERC